MRPPAANTTISTTTTLVVAFLVVGASFAGGARADDGMTFYGSLASRAQGTAPRTTSLRSTRDLAMLSLLSEANLRGDGRYLDERVSVFLDVSAFLIAQGGYADVDADGALTGVPDHEVTGAAPFVALSEFGVSVEPFDHLLLTFGKRRVTFGSGQAANPTDVLNPRRDPTDPSFQRTGVLLARADVPFERVTFTAIFSPAVLSSSHGLPHAVLAWPSALRTDDALAPPRVPDVDDDLHYAAIARVYALVEDTDVNAWIVATHRYQDDDALRPRVALSLSRVFFTSHELHLEALVQQGSTRRQANPACVDDANALGACLFADTPVFVQDLVDEERPVLRALVGWRFMPDDGSMLTVEYLYHSDGLSPGAFGDVAQLLSVVGEAERSGATTSGGSSTTSDGALPARFAFEPLRRHTLLASYMVPAVADDFTLQATVIASVEDLSSVASGAVLWQAREWLQLSVFGFLPIPSPGAVSRSLADDERVGVDVLGALSDAAPVGTRGYVPRGAVVGDRVYGEYDLAPFAGRIMLEARAYF